MKYIKKRLPVNVEFAFMAGVMQTLEGPVAYAAGDALMTASKGESWPINLQKFETTYEPVSRTKMGENGLYVKLPLVVEAEQMQTDFQVHIRDLTTILKGKKKDWLITAPDGSQWIVDDAIFRGTYINE